MRSLQWITAALVLLGLTSSLLLAGQAAADFGPIELVSKSATEQADEAIAPAISADGRYLAFEGTIGGLRGVFRKDLDTGAITTVAAGSAYEEEAPGADASAPSISADGRYVSFTTTTPLLPGQDSERKSRDVYVADMDSSPPTYELASALNRCDPASSNVPCGLTYIGSGGSVASARVALSADGREVVFVTTASSDLTSGPGGSTEGIPTPAGQVVLRNLETDETTLVSTERIPTTGQMTELPVKGGALIENPRLPLLTGAGLSADGTTVAWLGAHLLAQVPLLAEERQTISEEDESEYPYDEPLWRRMASGPQAPTRRIVGGGDPLAPGCPEAGTLADPACQGPFLNLTGKDTEELNNAEGWLGVSRVDGIPQLSANGRTVALIGNPSEATNVFVVEMKEGLSRVQAVHQLTREVSVDPSEPTHVVNREPYIPLNGHIFDLAISSNGERIAFVTARQQFPLSPPTLIGSPPSQLGLVELYLINREGETLERVTHGDGGVGEASLVSQDSAQKATEGVGATAPSFGDDGRFIAFASSASNLVKSDANEASDAFLVEDLESPLESGAVSISPAPVSLLPQQPWGLTLNAFSLADGNVRLLALVPGAGVLHTRVGAALDLGLGPKPVARVRAPATESGTLSLILKPAHRFRNLVRSSEGLYATARVSFRGAGGKPLREKLGIHFHAHASKKSRKR